ncbi:MAG: hypothetical protein LBH32_14305 [Dysgonamonadaceae bacterium]|nr:hypothetical protein [Dysgonamonadaceae bacterium]
MGEKSIIEVELYFTWNVIASVSEAIQNLVLSVISYQLSVISYQFQFFTGLLQASPSQ